MVEVLLNTFLFAIRNKSELSPGLIDTCLVHFINELMKKMRYIPLLRTQGSPSVKIPDVSAPIRSSLDGRWLSIADPANRFEKIDGASDVSLEFLRNQEARQIDFCREYFGSCDMFHYCPRTHVVLAMRRSATGGLIVGRIAYGSTSREPPPNPWIHWPMQTETLMGEHYSERGLYGVKFEHQSSTAAGKAKNTLGYLVFSDIRAAVILLALPDHLEFRKIAIGMLSEADNLRSFKDTRFSSYDWSPDETIDNSVASVVEFDL